MYVRTHLHVHIVNTCSIREGHFTCDAVAVNSKQSSVLNDLNYTVVDVIYHSVYTPPSFNICILAQTQATYMYIHCHYSTVCHLTALESIYIHTCAYLSMYCMCICISLYGELLRNV